MSKTFGGARNLAQFHDFASVARSDSSPEVRPILPDSSSPAQQVSHLFAFQSYFDSTLLERAILPQLRNNPIVPSTLQSSQTSGYAIGLHPSSQTPIAVQFTVGGQPSSSQPLVLRPGQIVRPHGLPAGMNSGSFSGFNWGLPFGWLGGGLATIYVFQTPDSWADWVGNAEVVYHRTRMAITSVGAMPADAPKNWPMRFPWTQAIQGTGSVGQQGAAQIAITEPLKTIMCLRGISTLAAPATMRILMQETNDLDVTSAGAVIATPVSFYDHTWDTFASVGAGNLGTQNLVVTLPENHPVTRLAADDGGIALVDRDGAGLAGAFVDIVRYGKL